jgi:hypothetical protein
LNPAVNKQLHDELAEIPSVLAVLRETDKLVREEIKKTTERIQTPVDRTEGISPICPVHGVKMRSKQVPILYGLLNPFPDDPTPDVRRHQFPYALTYWPAGCVERDPINAIIYICPECQGAEKRWRSEHRSSEQLR